MVVELEAALATCPQRRQVPLKMLVLAVVTVKVSVPVRLPLMLSILRSFVMS